MLQSEGTQLRIGGKRHSWGKWTVGVGVAKGPAGDEGSGRNVYTRVLGPEARIGR